MFARIREYFEHKAVAPNLSAYLDGVLSAPERERVERHLAVCARCQYELATLRQTVELLRRIPPKRVPRSFVLPASAQAERVAYRRWGLVNSFLRASAVGVTFMLVLLLSTEALFRFGAIPISAPMPAPQYVAPQAREVEALSEVVVTKEVEAESEEVVAQAPPSPEPTVELEVPVKEPPAEQPTASPGVSLLETDRGGGAAGGAPEQEVVVEKKALPVSPEAPAEGTFGAETRTAAMAQPAEAVPSASIAAVESATGVMGAAPSQDMVPSPTLTNTWTPAPSETPTATPTATEAPTATASATPQPTATATVTPRPSVTPIPTEPAPLVTAEPAEPEAAYASSPLWRLWGTVRLLSGLFVGLLFILFAGLLWTSRKRRV